MFLLSWISPPFEKLLFIEPPTSVFLLYQASDGVVLVEVPARYSSQTIVFLLLLPVSQPAVSIALFSAPTDGYVVVKHFCNTYG